jgi:energy-coupling factor transport system substrate-specific component
MTAENMQRPRIYPQPAAAPVAAAPNGARVPALAGGSGLLQRALGASIYLFATLIGIAAFTYPFFANVQQAGANATQQAAHGADSPLLLALLIGLCLAALAVEAQGQVLSAKIIALLGILVAINSALRFAETIVRGPGGFSPVFMLIILAGYVFGARFGFLMGILTLLVSAIVTAGIGPWLPYQMFTAGWMGMSAGWLRHLRLPIDDLRFSRGASASAIGNRQSAIQTQNNKLELIKLCVFGAMWGFLYGAITNLWFWPFQAGDPAQSWQAGLTLMQGVQRYLAFYAATSLVWDIFSAAGNIGLLLLFGIPTLKALTRFRNRFIFVSQL